MISSSQADPSQLKNRHENHSSNLTAMSCANISKKMSLEHVLHYRNRYDESDGEASSHGNGCLPVMIRSE